MEKNGVEAAKCFLKAAEQDDADAQYSLGKAYENGEGVETNIEKAMKWYRGAAGQSHKGAQRWFRQTAENGDSTAQSVLGELYYSGLIGVEVEMKNYPGVSNTEYHKNPTEAVKWFRRAAEQGNAIAQNNLGVFYENGVGVPIDYVEAYKWLNLAAAQQTQDGFAEISATMTRDKIAKEMTPDQIAEAQQLAREFAPHKGSSSGNSTSSESPTASGTGFFITDDGYLISNYHVVKGAAKVRLQTGAGLIDATVVKVDAANDLALLKAVGRFAPLPIAASRTVKLGGTVATVGFPDIGLQGFAPKLAKGEIASLAGAGDDPRYFQISLPVQPGNSGGALVDARGNVVGIVAAKLDASAALAATGSLPENVNYAVKSSLLLSFLESVPDVDAKLKDPNTKNESFEEVVRSAQDAAVLVLVY